MERRRNVGHQYGAYQKASDAKVKKIGQKNVKKNQYSRARELLCICTSLLDFIVIYICAHRCLLLAVGEALMVTLFSPGNASIGC